MITSVRSLIHRQQAAVQEAFRQQWLPRHWAEAQWGTVQLGDTRLTRRAVEMGTRMALRPGASLPHQMQTWAALKAAYRLLSNKRRRARVTFAALSQPHWQATRQRAQQEGAREDGSVLLLVQDITELDYSRYQETMPGLAPIGTGIHQRGVHLHSTLAVAYGPAGRQVLGLMHQQLFKRVPHAAGTRPEQRPKAERESRVWGEALEAIGAVPPGVRWVVIADRGADHFEFFWRCVALGYAFVLRMTYERRLDPLEPAQHLLSTARSWPATLGSYVDVAERGGRPARRARVLLSSAPVRLHEPQTGGGHSARPEDRGLDVWVVRVWEVDAPADTEPLEWILATTVPVESGEDLLTRVQWYRQRPVVEDYHQCLKTGTRAEARDLEDEARIERLLGFLALLAVRLLQLRDEAQHHPEAPARTVVDPLRLRLVAQFLGRPVRELSVLDFWRGVAQMGGYLGRKRDGPPGWKTVWRGWLELETMVRGAELAARSVPRRRR